MTYNAWFYVLCKLTSVCLRTQGCAHVGKLSTAELHLSSVCSGHILVTPTCMLRADNLFIIDLGTLRGLRRLTSSPGMVVFSLPCHLGYDRWWVWFLKSVLMAFLLYPEFFSNHYGFLSYPSQNYLLLLCMCSHMYALMCMWGQHHCRVCSLRLPIYRV